MLPSQPDNEIDRVTNRRTDQQQLRVFWKQSQRQLPHDASFRIIEAVKFVHDHGRHVVKRNFFRRQQSIEQDLSDDDENSGIRILTPITRHQSDV